VDGFGCYFKITVTDKDRWIQPQDASFQKLSGFSQRIGVPRDRTDEERT
jgi:hypothetical protein